MIDLIFFLIVFCLGAAASYFLLKGFYDNAQRYESMAGELREKSSKLFEEENEIKRLEEENKHLRTQGEKILSENNDLKDVNGSNSRYGYLISQAAEKASELLKILDVDGQYSKKEKPKEATKLEHKFEKFDPQIEEKVEKVFEEKDDFGHLPEPKHIVIEKDANFEYKPLNGHSGKRF